MKSPMVEHADYIKDKGSYTEMMVLQSGAGWYIGTLYNNPEGFQEPGGRDSDYFASKGEAQKYLLALLENSDLTEAGLLTRMKP